MSKVELQWWRVTVDGKGTVLDASLMEPCSTDVGNVRIYYLQAPSKQAAMAAAHVRYLEFQRLSLRERRLRNKAAGLCDCGQPLPSKDRKRCDGCNACSETSRKRRVAKERGESVPPLRPKSIAFAETRARREAAVRLATLQAALFELQRLGTLAKLAGWLMAEIKDAEAKAVCPKRI
jgi:hypothetical protein